MLPYFTPLGMFHRRSPVPEAQTLLTVNLSTSKKCGMCYLLILSESLRILGSCPPLPPNLMLALTSHMGENTEFGKG